MASHNKIYDLRQYGAPPRNPPPSFELPNEMIEAEIQLRTRINSVLQTLKDVLRQHNMDSVSPDYENNSITVSGIPPVNGFDQHTVLAIVQRHDRHASLLPR